jgi:two-component system OmpR family sensor kinase/two-component system sensor histidine kinase BaeS
VFFLLLAFIGSQFYRRVGSPVVDIMAAADAVADGDFSVRLSEEDMPGQFGRLKRSFNRMTAELERAEQQRRNMTADIAHELRTPLHIIQGNLEGVLDGVYAADNEHIAATLEETRLLARLVDDLQTLSLAEAGELHLHRERVPVADLFSDIQTSFSGPAAAAGVTLEVMLPPGEPLLEIDVDPDRMEQVLTNLVANAIRYTPAGGRILLKAEPLQTEDRPSGSCITVQDNGKGIAAEDLPFIFDRFWRADRSRTHHPGAGSGLGLAIARQLIQAHGGRIQATSRLNEGTTFTIEL